MKSLGPKVLATRMVREYAQELYAPAAASSARLAASEFAAAKELARWRGEVLAAWPGVSVLHVDSQLDGDPTLGGVLYLRSEVELNGLDASDVDVEAVYGPVDTENKLISVRSASLKLVGPADGTCRFEGQIPLDRTGSLGYTVRVLPKNALLATPAELGVVTTA